MYIRKFFQKFDLIILTSLILLPLSSLTVFPIYIYLNGIVWQEPLMLIIGWFLTGTGITVGYHRLFSHRTFKTYPIIEWVYMILGSMALQNTIVNWCSDHRRHHKLLDTDEDPYSIKKGFFHAHIGWVVKKGENNIKGVSDLQKKSAVKFQNKYYWTLSLFLSFIVPVLIGMMYNRPIGGLLWGGVVRVTLVHHFTFFINSFCHFLGKRNYDINTTARDSWFMAFLTFGEGYHNFHHKFQWDYRNGIKWYSFDPSKWIIKFLSYFNIAYDLRKAPDHRILRARINTLNEKFKEFRINVKYQNKINQITKKAMKDLNVLKILENKYNRLDTSKYEKMIYKQQKNFCKLKLRESISSLMLILVNLKNIT